MSNRSSDAPAISLATRSRVLGGATVGMVLSVLVIYVLGSFVAPLERDMGWTRAEISSAITLLTIGTALSNSVAGFVIDRLGSRRVALMVLPIYIAAFSSLAATTQSLWQWWATWFMLGVINGFSGPALWTSAVARIFTRRRGLALAVALCGTSIGSFLIPISTTHLIDSVGWRQAFVFLAAGFGGAALLAGAILPGPGASAPTDAAGPLPRQAARLSRRVILSRAYVLLALSASTFTLITSAFIVSGIPILVSHGIAHERAAAITASMGITGIVGRLGTGYLIDHFQPRFVTATAMALPAITAALLLANPGSEASAIVAMLILGLAMGAEFDALGVFISRLFELRHFGALFSILLSCVSIPAAIGPLGAGLLYDAVHSYTAVLVLVIPLSLISAALILAVGRVPGPTRAGSDARAQPGAA